MCTVSYIPSESGFFLTSNRDEHITRAKAIAPEKYSFNKHTFLYPRDPDKNGTWILAKENGDMVVLLNGAFENHIRKPAYRESRGKILLDIMRSDKPAQYFEEVFLEEIEPFTLVLFSLGTLKEYRWDGEKKHGKILDKEKEYIWSSATLYDKSALEKRNKWFSDWIRVNRHKSSSEIIQFHTTAGMGDLKDGLLMNRDGKMRTVSITQIKFSKYKMEMIYKDILDNTEHQKDLLIQQKKRLNPKDFRKDLSLRIKSLFIKAFHWEFWPFNMVYLPIMPYWFWLGLKSKSLFFFNTSNPGIKNGGFAMESKNDIYKQIPKGLRPETILIKPSQNWEEILEEIHRVGLRFPLIGKPDIGYKGIMVRKILNASELKNYTQEMKVDYLLQEFIPYKNEVGIFYYKIPGENKGQISGIVGKDFLKVRGNNILTVEELIIQEPRYLLQLPVLRQSHPFILPKILKEGEELILVPFGNHARGSKFVDQSSLISQELTETVNRICGQIPDFYFGRLDIMYHTWEELCMGKNFSIVELNGAGSEPTHIYDPSHSILFAWKEIIRHWKILNRISNLNKTTKGLEFLNFKQGIKLLRDNSNYFKLVGE